LRKLTRMYLLEATRQTVLRKCRVVFWRKGITAIRHWRSDG